MPEFADPGVGHRRIPVIHDGATLMVAHRHDFPFEIDSARGQIALTLIKISVERTRVHHRYMPDDGVAIEWLGDVEEVGVQEHFDALVVDHTPQPDRVSINRKPLVGVVEISAVVGVAHRKPRAPPRTRRA